MTFYVRQRPGRFEMRAQTAVAEVDEKDEYQQHDRGRRRVASQVSAGSRANVAMFIGSASAAQLLDEVLVAGGVEANRTDDEERRCLAHALAMPSTVPVRMPGIAAGDPGTG